MDGKDESLSNTDWGALAANYASMDGSFDCPRRSLHVHDEEDGPIVFVARPLEVGPAWLHEQEFHRLRSGVAAAGFRVLAEAREPPDAVGHACTVALVIEATGGQVDAVERVIHDAFAEVDGARTRAIHRG